MRRMRNPNELFVGDLSYFCGEEQLYDLFGQYGGILDVRIKRSDAKGKTLMYGFVKMESLKSALLAAKELNGALYMGRLMRVQLSLTNTNYENNAQTKAGFQVHVSVSSRFPDEEIIQPHEGIIRNVFEAHNGIVDIVIKDYKVHKGENRQEGYGFITFGSEEQALAAVQACNRVITPEGIKIECSLSHRNKANAVMRQFEDQNYGQDPSMASPHMYSPSQHPMDRNRGHATANVYMPNQENITLSSDSTDESQWNAPYHTGKDGNKYAASQRSPASTATSGMYGHDAGSSSSHSYMDSNAGPMHPPPPPPPQPVYNSPPILNPNYSMYLSTISMQQQQYLQSMNNSFTPTYSTPNMMPSPVPPPGYMTIAPPPPAPQPAYRINGYPPIGMMRYQTAEYPMMDMNQQESQPRNVYMPRPQQYHPHQHQPHQHQPPPSYQPSGYGKPY